MYPGAASAGCRRAGARSSSAYSPEHSGLARRPGARAAPAGETVSHWCARQSQGFMIASGPEVGVKSGADGADPWRWPARTGRCGSRGAVRDAAVEVGGVEGRRHALDMAPLGVDSTDEMRSGQGSPYSARRSRSGRRSRWSRRSRQRGCHQQAALATARSPSFPAVLPVGRPDPAGHDRGQPPVADASSSEANVSARGGGAGTCSSALRGGRMGDQAVLNSCLRRRRRLTASPLLRASRRERGGTGSIAASADTGQVDDARVGRRTLRRILVDRSLSSRGGRGARVVGHRVGAYSLGAEASL